MTPLSTGPRRRRRWQPRERIALACLALLPVLAVLGGWGWLEMAAVVWLCFIGFGMIVMLRGDWRLIGPHFWFDLVGLARRGRSAWVRLLYLLAMLFSLYVISIDEFGSGSLLDFFRPSRLSQQQLVRLAEKFMAAVIFVQNLAVLLLTPAYLATAVTEEREKRSLELLQTTHLYDREIILGKLLGRLTHLAGVLLAGLPVLSLTQFMGGVDMAVLLANFAVTFMNLWTAGCICIMLSVVCKSGLEAVAMSYCFMPILLIVHAIVAAMALGKGSDVIILSQQYIGGDYWKLLEVLRALLLAHGVISSFCLVVALGGLRPFVLSQKALANVKEPEAAPRTCRRRG